MGYRKVLFLPTRLCLEINGVLYIWGRLGFDNLADFLVSMSCAECTHVNKYIQTLSGNTSYALAA